MLVDLDTMSKTFLISDTHFGHANILTFLDEDGKQLRPFSSVQEMDETMVDNWNKTVSKNDKVYHLGDVLFSNRVLQTILPRLNGTKILIKGNHDNLKPSQYLQFFKDIRAYHVLDKFVLSHVPIHPDSVSRWKGNLHGHLHAGVVKKEVVVDTEIGEMPALVQDGRYMNLSVECIGYTPMDFEYIREYFNH